MKKLLMICATLLSGVFLMSGLQAGRGACSTGKCKTENTCKTKCEKPVKDCTKTVKECSPCVKKECKDKVVYTQDATVFDTCQQIVCRPPIIKETTTWTAECPAMSPCGKYPVMEKSRMDQGDCKPPKLCCVYTEVITKEHTVPQINTKHVHKSAECPANCEAVAKK